MSKFMFHIRFSDQGRFLHENEVYEMMRSRSLYQVQFDLKHKLRKRLRSLEQAEKMQVSSFQKQRNVFLTKMQEKVVQRNKLAEENSTQLMMSGVKRHIQAKDKHVRMVTDENSVTPKHAKSAPSRILAKESPRNRPVTKEATSARLVSKETTLSSVKEVTHESDDIKPVSAKVELSYRGRSLPGCKSGYRRSRTMFSDDVTYINTSSFVSREQAEHTSLNDEGETSSKTLLSRQNTKSQTPKSIRKSSRVGLPNILPGPSSRGESTFFEQEDNISEISDTAFQRLAGKYNKAKSLTSLSMPVPTPDLKSVSSYEMGMTTPEGQLILSRDEYEDYLDRFREAKSKRLKLIRRQSENLDQKVKHFRALRKQ
ncbi:uncharacterized protein LOC110448654 [Mizuhopecten yessoensis]|uniref:Uncharacterized protein n=1 Tax=Mizuhopecten yessoensis TaxID=6573 RepID=A0A210R5Y7_MIZYE|nr:uncharacterized protein LOC110448654 [Mizuhopecten yessoensis]OWF56346.1 hypothetical protein KP79_PYT08301 [Mizuhopecten yessoensis]